MNEGAIHYLAEILGKDRPEVRRMLQTAAFHPEKAHLVRRHMLMLLRREGYDLSDLPVFGRNLPEEIPREGIFLGHIILGNGETRELFIPLDSFRRHTLVCGMTGSGKSTLIKWLIPQLARRGIVVWIFDHEGEYGVLLKQMEEGEVCILDQRSDRDNPLEPPPGWERREWTPILKNLVRSTQYLRDGSMNLLGWIMGNVYRNRENPCIQDVLDVLAGIEFKPGTRYYSYRESLINRFKGIRDELGDVVMCRKGYDYRDLAKYRVIINRTGGMSDEKRQFYINLKMLKAMSWLEKEGSAGFRIVFVVDEAHKLYSRKLEKRSDMGEPLIFSSARTFTKRGMGCIWLDQVPSQMPPAVAGNINNHICMRLMDGGCIKRVSSQMNLHREEREQLPVLEDRRAVFQSGDFPDPVLVEIPEIRFQEVSEEEIERYMEKILPRLPYVPVSEEQEPAPEAEGVPETRTRPAETRPNRTWKRIAELLAESKYLSLTPMREHLDYISHWKLNKILHSMSVKGYIELCKVNLGTRGNPRTYVVLKEKGAELAGKDFQKVRLRGKGSLEHLILQNMLAEAMRDSGKAVEVEKSARGKSVDIAETGEKGSTAYEIELSPAHQHVAENVRLDLEAGFRRVVVLTRSRAEQNEAKAQIYQSLDWEKLTKVEYRLIREFL